MSSAPAVLAYHSDPATKSKFVNRATAHREADEIVQKYGYWHDDGDGFKGCAIGCLAEVDVHAHEALEREAGLPLALSHLADSIFEGLDEETSKDWPRRYAEAARPGANLTRVHHRFCHWLLTEEVTWHFDPAKCPDIADVCVRTAELHRRAAAGDAISDEDWLTAESAAVSAAWSAVRSADASVAGSAADSAMWLAAESAAWSAAGSAMWLAAWSAVVSVAESASWSAAVSAAGPAARLAARSAAFGRMADQLEGLMSAA